MLYWVLDVALLYSYYNGNIFICYTAIYNNNNKKNNTGKLMFYIKVNNFSYSTSAGCQNINNWTPNSLAFSQSFS